MPTGSPCHFRFGVRAVVIVALATIWLAVLATDALAARPTFAPDVVLVAFKPEVSHQSRHELIQGLGLEIDEGTLNPYFYRLTLTPKAKSAGVTVEGMVDRLMDCDFVRIAEPDWMVSIQATVPNDARFNDLWAMRNTGQLGGVVGADIKATLAWDLETGDPNLKVAVIDTGIHYNNVDLAANMWTNPGEIAGNGIDDDNNGRIDDIHGYDFVNNDGNPVDDHSHGTHVSGTIGAVGNNGIGVTGVCWNVKLIACKAFNASGLAFMSHVVFAIDYARVSGARVMSNSYAFGVYSQVLFEAVRRTEEAGIVFVAGAGNNNWDTDLTPLYPAGFSTMLSNVLSVGATNRYAQRAPFSNFGLTSVDLMAPGVEILSTYPGNVYILGSGTSMACPHVSGAAALLLSHYPEESPAQIRSRLRASADRVPALADLSASGSLNVFEALIATSKSIQGTVNLQNWTATYNSQRISVYLKQNGVLVETIPSIALNETGVFSCATFRSGVHEILVKADHWLAREHPFSIDLGPGGVSGLYFSLINGDVDRDNEVSAGDYAALSSAFGSNQGELNWNPQADLNGDEAVDIGDFAILSTNFGHVGDD